MAKTPAEKPEEQAATASTKAVEEAPVKVAKTKRPLAISANLATFLVVVAIFGYLIYGSWQAFKAPVEAVAIQVSPTPSIPELKLNQDNKREAPPITVDQNGIGKQDPFTP